MDSFDYESLDRYIRKFKRNLIIKLENSNYHEIDLKNQSDLLCMVLDYSPKFYDEKKNFNKKIIIKPSSLFLEELNEKNDTKTFFLEKQNSNDQESSESEKEQTIKLSRFSSKIDNKESIFDNKNMLAELIS